MSETTHMQLLQNASRMELMLLVAVVLEARAAGRADVVLLSAAKRLTDTVCSWTHDDRPCSGGFWRGVGGARSGGRACLGGCGWAIAGGGGCGCATAGGCGRGCGWLWVAVGGWGALFLGWV
jgi:hypothetical protein